MRWPETFYDLLRWHDGANPETELPRNLVLAYSDGKRVFRGGSYGDMSMYGKAPSMKTIRDDVHGRMRVMRLTPDERSLVSAGDDGVIAVRSLA